MMMQSEVSNTEHQPVPSGMPGMSAMSGMPSSLRAVGRAVAIIVIALRTEQAVRSSASFYGSQYGNRAWWWPMSVYTVTAPYGGERAAKRVPDSLTAATLQEASQ
jgi:hypothetical protein